MASSIFTCTAFPLRIDLALAYFFVRFLSTEASVKDIVALNSTLGTRLRSPPLACGVAGFLGLVEGWEATGCLGQGSSRMLTWTHPPGEAQGEGL